MDLSLSNWVVAENPPWASQPMAASWTTVKAQVPAYEGFFTQALKRKLVSVYAASQSVELNRQVLLALHDSSLTKAQSELVNYTLEGSIRLGSLAKRTALREANDVDVLIINDILPHPSCLSEFYPKSYAFGFGQILLLHFFSYLLDRIADYWNATALGRLVWRDIGVKLRHLLERALQFKPFHTPSRLIPRSIHPIGSAA